MVLRKSRDFITNATWGLDCFYYIFVGAGLYILLVVLIISPHLIKHLNIVLLSFLVTNIRKYFLCDRLVILKCFNSVLCVCVVVHSTNAC